jgi:phage gp29-like protein
VKYRGAQLDKKQREAVLNKFANNTSGAVDLPADIDVNSENQTSVSQNALFENYVKYFDEQMTKLVLGSTMTMDAGSSRSQAEVHERSTESLFDADAVMVLNMLNYDFYEIGVNMFNLPQGGRWSFVENATTKNMQQVELDLKLAQLGVVFTNDELRKKYNL